MSAPARRTSRKRGSHPLCALAHPVSSSAERNSCRTNGCGPARAFHSAASTPARESTTRTLSKALFRLDAELDADPLGHLGIEALDALVLGAQLVAAAQAVPDARELVAGVGIERLQPRRFLELRRRFLEAAKVGERQAQPVPG